MRALVSAVFVGSIIALLLVSGCTDILSKQKAGGFGQVSPTVGTGGGTGGGKSGVSPVQGAYTPSSKYSRFQLNYYYRDMTNYPRYANVQTCGPCDAVVSEQKSDESHDELLIEGVIGGMVSPELYNPHNNLEVSPALSPRMSFSGKNYQREYDWMENYAPASDGKNGCQGRGESDTSGYEYETVTQGECNHIQVRITGVDGKKLMVTIQHAADGSECKSDETYVKRYKGKSAMPDSVRTDKRDTSGEYHVVCAPYEKGVVQSDETEDYFFGKGPGEQTTRDFSVDVNGVYHIVCSGSKDEVLEPACTGCSKRSCWPGSAATRHQERFLEILISPADKPVTLMPRVTESLASLAPLVPKK